MVTVSSGPRHRARTVLKCFEEHQSEFNLLPWPVQFVDLIPIEHLWDEVGSALRSLEMPTSNLIHLRAEVITDWANIPPNWYQLLIESILRIISAIIRDKGGANHY